MLTNLIEKPVKPVLPTKAREEILSQVLRLKLIDGDTVRAQGPDRTSVDFWVRSIRDGYEQLPGKWRLILIDSRTGEIIETGMPVEA